LAREVNLREMPEEEQRHVETARAEAWPPLDSGDLPLGDRLSSPEGPPNGKASTPADGAAIEGQRQMPTKEQMDRVVNAVQALRKEYSFTRVDDEHVALASYGRATEDGYFFWDELVPPHRRDALTRGIDWDGFNPSERADVIMRVLDDEPA